VSHGNEPGYSLDKVNAPNLNSPAYRLKKVLAGEPIVASSQLQEWTTWMAPKKKTQPELLRKLREGGFVFHIYPDETEVHMGRRCLGGIVGMKEQSGRHCFRLACDRRRAPRTYRGRIQAAEALLMIDDLKRAAKKHRWSTEELIIRSWDAKPRASQSLYDE